MTKQQKKALLETLKPLFEGAHLYITDCEGMTANQMFAFRKNLFQANILCRLVPNTLLNILFKEGGQTPLQEILKKNSTVLVAKENPSTPAQVIMQFKKEHKIEKPLLKGAWAYGEAFIGEAQLKPLSMLKSKEELLGDLLALLGSPVRRVLSALESAPNKLQGIVQTLSDK